jgi:hypothetical protein
LLLLRYLAGAAGAASENQNSQENGK